MANGHAGVADAYGDADMAAADADTLESPDEGMEEGFEEGVGFGAAAGDGGDAKTPVGVKAERAEGSGGGSGVLDGVAVPRQLRTSKREPRQPQARALALDPYYTLPHN